jgi:hypothetical protein
VKIITLVRKRLKLLHLDKMAMSVKTSNGVTVNLLGDINLAKAKGIRSFVEQHWKRKSFSAIIIVRNPLSLPNI